MKLSKKHKLRNSAQVGSHSAADQYSTISNHYEQGSFFHNANVNKKSKNQMMMANRYGNDLSKMVSQNHSPFESRGLVTKTNPGATVQQSQDVAISKRTVVKSNK